jgi:anti-anti-sigma factor
MIDISTKPHFEITTLNRACLIRLTPVFTVTEAVAFKEVFQQLCQVHRSPARIVLDFSQTCFIDSSGVGALVSCRKIALTQGIDLVFWSLCAQVELVLSLTGLDQVFTVDQNTKGVPLPVLSAKPDPQPVSHPSVQSKIKRLIDIIGSLVGLAITGILLIPLAIAIRLDSPGPIFFSQIRCGWMGKKFRLWKLRSMVSNASQLKHLVKNEVEGAIFKNSNDPRITRVGRFLRRTSLDELPQFWNVLRGEMSLVGTRPPTPDEVEIYEVPEWQRLNVKPGMTGEWQVYGRSTVKSFEEVIRLDLRYQRNWSLQYDLQLIFKTIWIVFNKNSGAF